MVPSLFFDAHLFQCKSLFYSGVFDKETMLFDKKSMFYIKYFIFFFWVSLYVNHIIVAYGCDVIRNIIINSG